MLLNALLARAGIGANVAFAQPALPDGATFDFGVGGPTLRVLFAGPSQEEVVDIRRGRCEFALVPLGPVLFLLSKFGAQEWMDSPHSIQMLPPSERRLPEEFRVGLRYGLTVQVVDTCTQLQHGARFVTFGADFSARLHSEVQKQLHTPLSRTAYESAVAEAYRRFPTPESMLSCAVVRTLGGT